MILIVIVTINEVELLHLYTKLDMNEYDLNLVRTDVRFQFYALIWRKFDGKNIKIPETEMKIANF